jgi:hypothetical protein
LAVEKRRAAWPGLADGEVIEGHRPAAHPPVNPRDTNFVVG